MKVTVPWPKTININIDNGGSVPTPQNPANLVPNEDGTEAEATIRHNLKEYCEASKV